MSCKKFVLTDCEDRTQLRHKKKHPQVTQSAETALDNEGSFREGSGVFTLDGRGGGWKSEAMPRRLRVATGGYAYHVLNRGVGKMRLFAKERDFEAFEEVMAQAKEWLPMRVLAWCVMSTHWHFVLWPREDGDLSEFKAIKRDRQLNGTGPITRNR